jgi:prepilin-type N-terminal cleavage/methylation domain-containing protein
MIRGWNNPNSRAPVNGEPFLSEAVLRAVEGPGWQYENFGFVDGSPTSRLDPSTPANTPRLRKFNLHRTSRRAFTLIEVLAAMLLIAIVLPVVMQGITAGAGSSSTTRRRTEASGLAEAKLGELIATGDWQGGVLSGDFSPDWSDYKWQATVTAWTQDTTNSNLQEIDLRVFWKADNREDSVTVASLAYNRTPQ